MPTTKAGVRSTRQHADLLVRRVRGMGRGIFAGRAFRAADVIEVCPVIILPGVSDEKSLGNLQHYVFKWGKAGDGLAIALGYGSLYNHSPNPNADFALRLARDEIVFRAVRQIPAGEQILIDYGWDETDYASFRRTG